MEIYEIGGSIRDRLLEIQSKDRDFVVIPTASTIDLAWKEMTTYLELQGYQIFLATESCYTVRAKFPTIHENAGLVADFVLARKELGYYPNTRQPILAPGTIADDVWRRDFTINTLFEKDGEIIDLTGRGIEDLKLRLIDTPLDAYITFKDDPLRIFRAIRFSITKKFNLSDNVADALHYSYDYSTISIERVREELYKCFKFNTMATLKMLYKFEALQKYAFDHTGLWLKPTTEC
jgi:tRNA nucleotidyltransferase/poly(A) polymerase